MRTCSIDGCDKTHRARGLCSTHYNRAYQPDRHRPVETPCVICGRTVARGSKGDRRHVCSLECWRVLRGSGGPGYDWAGCAMRRATLAGAVVVERIEREAVFERDGWTCQMCGVLVSDEAGPFASNAATVDHITPLSHGGQHTMDNVQTACLRCNSAKQDRAA